MSRTGRDTAPVRLVSSYKRMSSRFRIRFAPGLAVDSFAIDVKVKRRRVALAVVVGRHRFVVVVVVVVER